MSVYQHPSHRSTEKNAHDKIKVLGLRFSPLFVSAIISSSFATCGTGDIAPRSSSLPTRLHPSTRFRICTRPQFEAKAFQGPWDEEPVWKIYKVSLDVFLSWRWEHFRTCAVPLKGMSPNRKKNPAVLPRIESTKQNNSFCAETFESVRLLPAPRLLSLSRRTATNRNELNRHVIRRAPVCTYRTSTLT